MSQSTGNEQMSGDQHQQRIIVIGASAGGFEAIKKLVAALPADFNASIFIVWHMSPDVRGVLPQVLNKLNSIPAAHASNNEEIEPRRIYVAPPDHHLLLQNGKVQVTKGPKENRFRPAVDPLFRSAAYMYGSRVIGIILSGALDDGTSGLWTIKRYQGTTMVQDPKEAEVPSMPESALRNVEIDYCLGIAELSAVLIKLTTEPFNISDTVLSDEETKKEINIAAETRGMNGGRLKFHELSPYTCPECHGVLSKLQNDNIIRYRCHTGHAYSADSLMATISEKIEDSLYSAMRGIDESMMLLNHLGDHAAELNQPRLASLYFQKAHEAEDRGQLVRKAIFANEQLSNAALQQEGREEILQPD